MENRDYKNIWGVVTLRTTDGGVVEMRTTADIMKPIDQWRHGRTKGTAALRMEGETMDSGQRLVLTVDVDSISYITFVEEHCSPEN